VWVFFAIVLTTHCHRNNRMDRSELFLNPVSRVDVPDYFDVIKEPMSWSEIDAKLEGHLYETADDFAVSHCSRQRCPAVNVSLRPTA
jgi:hypothetical protein